jgi:hypothetical protein
MKSGMRSSLHDAVKDRTLRRGESASAVSEQTKAAASEVGARAKDAATPD